MTKHEEVILKVKRTDNNQNYVLFACFTTITITTTVYMITLPVLLFLIGMFRLLQNNLKSAENGTNEESKP